MASSILLCFYCCGVKILGLFFFSIFKLFEVFFAIVCIVSSAILSIVSSAIVSIVSSAITSIIILPLFVFVFFLGLCKVRFIIFFSICLLRIDSLLRIYIFLRIRFLRIVIWLSCFCVCINNLFLLSFLL
jgi:hypothetical protein